MKRTIIILFSLLWMNNAKAQNAYYDALLLASVDAMYLGKIESAASAVPAILSLHGDELQNLNNYKEFLTDPFKDLEDKKLDGMLLRKTIQKYETVLHPDEISSQFMAGALSGLGANLFAGDLSISPENQTKLIDGLVKYYAEEFKKAKLVSYMNGFEATIGQVGEFQLLFPETYDKLKTSDPSKLPDLGNEYKELFNEDLKKALDNLVTYVDKVNTDTLNCVLLTSNNCSKIRASNNYEDLKITADIASKLINNYHPVDLFHHLDNKYYDSNKAWNVKSIAEKMHLPVFLHGINILQHNLLDTSSTKDNQFSNVWLDFEKFSQINTSNEMKYFLGLIYQQDREYFDKLLIVLGITSGTKEETIRKWFNTYGKAVLESLTEIQNFRSNLTSDNLDDSYIEFSRMIFHVIENFAISEKNAGDDHLKSNLLKVVQIADDAINFYDNVRRKDYSNSIFYCVEIVKKLLQPKLTVDQEELIEKLDWYASFMADVINSENSDEVKDIIKKYAAPPASYIFKRQYAWTISITGQPGYFVASERINSKGFCTGLSLPIGIEYSIKLGPGNTTATSGSLGFFLQAFDFASVLTYRISNETSELPDSFQIKDFVSPGFSLTYGFKNQPISLGIGYQYTPALRRITDESGNEFWPRGNRVFLRLSWDIPMVNIAKSKRWK